MQATLRRAFKIFLYLFLALATFVVVFFFGESKQIGKTEKGTSLQGFGNATFAYADAPVVVSSGEGGAGDGGGGGEGEGDGGSSSGG